MTFELYFVRNATSGDVSYEPAVRAGPPPQPNYGQNSSDFREAGESAAAVASGQPAYRLEIFDHFDYFLSPVPGFCTMIDYALLSGKAWFFIFYLLNLFTVDDDSSLDGFPKTVRLLAFLLRFATQMISLWKSLGCRS